jgi:hypothetical protein
VKITCFWILLGFKRGEVTVRHNYELGEVEITGQSVINGFFHKDVKIPEDCNGQEIRSKFESGILSITMPKKNHWLSSAGGRIKSTNFDSYIIITVAIALSIVFSQFLTYIFTHH